MNNESGFEAKNIQALCDVGKSTKTKHTLGYIGKFMNELDAIVVIKPLKT